MGSKTRRQYLRGIRRRLVRFAGQRQPIGLANAISEVLAVRQDYRAVVQLCTPCSWQPGAIGTVIEAPTYDYVSVPRSFRHRFGARLAVPRLNFASPGHARPCAQKE
jgi:hypothetical protein